MHESLKNLPLDELRHQWAKAWGYKPYVRMRRKMLECSLAYKIREKNGQGLSSDQQRQLEKLVADYKANPACFDEGHITLKPGIKLLRTWKGKLHTVSVVHDGFEYQGLIYTSLSAIASEITGTQWNGWLFFDLKRQGRAA